MRIRFDEELGTLELDGVVISAKVLRELANPDRRALFRFQRKDGIIQAVVYSENEVLWFPKSEEQDCGTVDFGVENQSGNEERKP